MTVAPPTDAEWETAVGRAAVYGLCATALAYPTPARAEAVARLAERMVAGVRTGRPRLDAAIARAVALAVRHDEATVDARRRAWLLAFSAVESQDCPAHEATYETNDVFRQAHLMADVAAFYRAHGLAVGGEERERPDHVATELEYLGFLARKEAYAIEALGPDQRAECVRTQRSFLRDHAGRWVPSFGRRLGRVADEPLLAAVGDLIAEWVEADLDRLDVVLAALLDEPAPPLPPDDGMCGLPEDAPSGEVAERPVRVRRHRRDRT